MIGIYLMYAAGYLFALGIIITGISCFWEGFNDFEVGNITMGLFCVCFGVLVGGFLLNQQFLPHPPKPLGHVEACGSGAPK
jgi:hypothetical protein